MEIIEKLELVSKQTNSQARVAKYLLEKQDIDNLKIQKLMDECFVSIATATRVAKKCGYKGFSEFKYALIEAKSKQQILENKSENLEMENYSLNLMKAIDTSFNKENESAINFMINKIHNAIKVDFFAVGGSSLISQDFAYKLDRVGKYITNYSDFHMQFIQAKKSNEKTVAIGISYSGTTTEVLRCLKIAKENGATTILLTWSGNSSLDFIDKYVLLNVDLTNVDNKKRISRITMLALLDLAYLKLIEIDPKLYNEILFKTKFIK